MPVAAKPAARRAMHGIHEDLHPEFVRDRHAARLMLNEPANDII
jgi:hypothetical protein